MRMGDSECKRTRKPINYAEIRDVSFVEEDFDDFKTTSKDKREKTKDRTEKLNGEERKDSREGKHDRDKLGEHKKNNDRDRHKRDRDKHRERHSRERDERKVDHRPRHEKKRKEHEEKRHRSERRDNDGIDSGRNEGSSDSKYDSSDSQRTHDSQGSNKTTTSPIVSPSRRNPKPRLTIEEKVFQRELQAVLELSKADCIQESANTPEAGKHPEKEEGTTLDTTQCTQAASSPKSLQGHSVRGACSPPIQDTVAPGEAFSSTPNEAGTPEGVKVVVKLPVLSSSPPPVSPPPLTTRRGSDVMEPQPSTSTGLGLKRARKTVNFKEDSDSSDGFDGFIYNNSADSDTSEWSDFVLSPKKKKSKDSKKTVKTSKTTKNSVCKSSIKTPDKNKAAHQMSSSIHLDSAKENTAPKCLATSPSPQANTVASPRVSIAPEPKLPSGSSSPKTLPTKASTAKGTTGVARPVRRPLVNTSSPSSGTSSIGLVKTQFINPLATSPGSPHSINSPATSVGARSQIQRGTGLRLGLSRRASIKPLHPSVAGKITD